MNAMPDSELLERWRAGEARAGQQLTARHFKTVRAYFLNKAPNEHEDLVQETFARMLAARDKYRGAATFRSFLLGVARMILLEHLRAKRRGMVFDPLEHSVIEGNAGHMSSVFARRESHKQVLLALRQLSLVEQELLELYYCQQLTAREVGELQGLPESTIRSRVHVALSRARTAHAKLSKAPAQNDIEFEGWLAELGREWMEMVM